MTITQARIEYWREAAENALESYHGTTIKFSVPAAELLALTTPLYLAKTDDAGNLESVERVEGGDVEKLEQMRVDVEYAAAQLALLNLHKPIDARVDLVRIHHARKALDRALGVKGA